MAYDKISQRLDRIEKELRDLRDHLVKEDTGEIHSSELNEARNGLSAIDTRILEDEAAKKAALLHKQGLSYFQIALQICPARDNPSHHCGRKCATQLRKAAKPYLTTRRSAAG